MKRLIITVVTLVGLASVMVSVMAAEFRSFGPGSRLEIERAHMGKPFALVFWSLDCAYCLDEIRQLSESAGSRSSLQLVLVNTDAPELTDSAAEVLSQALKKVPVERWVFDGSDSARLFFAVDKRWRGELPRTYIYDAKGNFKAISGKLDQNWLKELVQNGFFSIK